MLKKFISWLVGFDDGYVVDKDSPPPMPRYGVINGTHWERSFDPWHLYPFDLVVVEDGVKREGWVLMDLNRKPVLFVGDGAIFPDMPDSYRFENGPSDQLIALPVN